MIMIPREYRPNNEPFFTLTDKEMALLWYSLEFFTKLHITKMSDDFGVVKKENKHLEKEVLPFYQIKAKIKMQLSENGSEGPWDEDEDIHGH